MSRSFSNRLTALAAVVALVVATGAYLFHGHSGENGQQNELRCELCLQFNGTAGAVPAPVALLSAALLVFVVAGAAESAPRPTSRARAHRARGPPVST